MEETRWSSQIWTVVRSFVVIVVWYFQTKYKKVADQKKGTFNSSDRDNRDRTGIPTSLARHDMGLATTIANTDRDASGHKIDATMRSTMNRLRVWHFRTQAYTPTDKNLLQAFNELDLLKDKLSLPDASVQKVPISIGRFRRKDWAAEDRFTRCWPLLYILPVERWKFQEQ